LPNSDPFRSSSVAKLLAEAHAAFVYQVLDNRFFAGALEERPDGDTRVAGNIAGGGLFKTPAERIALGRLFVNSVSVSPLRPL
jgi:hypothetical protein